MSGHRIKNVVTFGVVIGCALSLLIGLIALDFLLGPGIFLSPAKPDPILEMAQSRVHIGDERNTAIQALSDAWFHTECRSTDSATIRDLFFYGPHNRDDVKIVLVVSKEVNNTSLVVFVGGEENYMLHLYDNCIPPVLQAFNGEGGAIPIATPCMMLKTGSGLRCE